MARAIALLLLILLTGCTTPPPQQPPTVQEPPDPTSLGSPDLASARPISIQRTPAPANNGPPANLTRAAFTSEQTGFAVTWDGSIQTTTDGGRTWRRLFQQDGARLANISFDPTHQTGLVLGRTGCNRDGECQGVTIIRTVDAGQTWQAIDPQGLPQTDGAFTIPTATTAYVADRSGGLLKSADAGQTWQPMQLPEGLTPTGGISFLTAERGYVTASQGERHGALLTTADGGQTWTTLYEGDVPIHAVQFVDEQIGYIGGGHGHWRVGPLAQVLLTTTDGGQTWQERYRNEDYNAGWGISRIHFYSPTQGWAEQDFGPLLSTTDGGRTWTPHLDGRSAIGAALLGPRAWLPFNDAIFHTADGGQSWEPLYGRADLQPSRIQFVNPQTGFLTTGPAIFQTVDGGETWEPIPLKPHLHHATHFASGQVAFRFDGEVFSPNNKLLRTADGGQTWTPVLAGLEEPRSISFPAPETGFIAFQTNRSGPDAPYPDTFMTTTDGGQNWTRNPVDLPVGSDLAFADPKHGVAAAGYIDQRKLMTTADGGQTWLSLDLPKLWFRSVDYAPGGHIWVGAVEEEGQRRGLLLHSPDRGATWEVFELKDVGEFIFQVEFTTPVDGWLLVAIEQEMILARTRDGGKSWTQVRL